jgi:prepilin-type processing-associated H-X9-DG protein
VSYADAFKGYLIEVGLDHGGSGGSPELSWVNTLSEYYQSPIAVKSPGDDSVYWPAELGGAGQLMNGRARRTSYGMNSWVSRSFPPGISAREPFDRMEKIQAPSATVQFLLMAEKGEYAASDHVHPDGWGNAARAPAVAATQVEIGKWGGPAAGAASLSNYGFLDGHASAHRFVEVYEDAARNRFNPEVAH